MKVKQLIRQLKKLPQNLRVGVAMHDNSEGEVAGWVSSVDEEEELVYGEDEDEVGWAGPKTKSGKMRVILHC